MWNRREIKKQGRRQLLRNWWTTVAVCFILAFTGAEFADSVGFVRELDLSAIPGSEPAVMESVHLSNWDILLKWLEVDPTDGTHPLWAAADQSVKPVFETLTQPFSAFFAFLDRSQFTGWTGVSLAVIGVLGGLWFAIWVVGVLAVGARRYLLESRVRDRISLSALFFPFGRGRWWNAVRVILVRTVYTLLWSLTVVGLPIKLYAYRMVPYILAENPGATAREAITLSRRMMAGQKWRCFVVDLTFYLHWTVLPLVLLQPLAFFAGLYTGEAALCTYLVTVATGLLSIFFVNGYKAATFAQLYVALRQDQLDRGTELSRLFLVPAFGEEPASGPKPRVGEAARPSDGEGVFQYAGKLDYARKYNIRTLILLFFAFSLVGWLWEVALHIVQAGVFANRGTLYGPWLPIYGTGGVAVLILLKKCFKSVPLTFVASMAVCSVIEYWSSWWLEYTKGVRYWDYSSYFMNLNGRICLEGALVFGLGCCAVIYFAGPLVAGQIDRINPRRQAALCVVLLALYGADNVYSGLHPNVGEGITEGPAVQQAALEVPGYGGGETLGALPAKSIETGQTIKNFTDGRAV